MKFKKGDRVIITKRNSSLEGKVANITDVGDDLCRVSVSVKPNKLGNFGPSFYEKRHFHILYKHELKPHPTKIEDLL